MKVGLLWFDNDPKADLKTKIERLVAYYTKKYGQAPNLCYVHPSMVTNGNGSDNGIEVRPNRSVLPNHFWVGMKDEAA